MHVHTTYICTMYYAYFVHKFLWWSLVMCSEYLHVCYIVYSSADSCIATCNIDFTLSKCDSVDCQL